MSFLTVILSFAAIGAATSQCFAAEGGTHRFLKAGWASGGVALFAADGSVEWELPCKDELSDAWSLPDGGIAYSFSRRKQGEAGMVRLGPDKQPLWEYRVPAGHDNHSCQPLPGGGFLLGETAKDGLWMVELNAEGELVKRIAVEAKAADYHHAFRQVRKTAQGTYLGTLMKENTTYEWDATGKVVRTFPDGHYVAVRLPSGNTLVSCRPTEANGRSYAREFTPEGNVAWQFTEADIDRIQITMGMVCGLQRLPNGDTVLSNVKHGHSHGSGPAPKLFEVTPEGQLVWQLPADAPPGNMGCFQILDAGEPALR